MFKLKKTLLFLCLFCLLTTVPVMAEEGKTQAQILQEALLNGERDPDIETEQTPEPTSAPAITEPEKTELELAWENLSAGQIVTGIKQLDVDNPDAGKVRALRISYDKLSSSDKVRVTNIDALAQAEEKLEEAARQGTESTNTITESNDNKSTNQENINATEYTFEIQKRLKNLTLVLRYTTDDNQDGRGDTPTITLTAPDGIDTTLTSKMTELKDSRTYMSFIWEQSFFQMDVAYAAEGNWTVKTDIPVTFMKSDYRGSQVDITAIQEKKSESDSSNTTNTTTQYSGNSMASLYLILVLFILIAAAGAFAYLFLFKNGLKGKLKPKNKPNEDEEELKTISEDEEIALIRKELERQRQLDEEEEAKRREAEARKEKNVNRDERFMYTQEPMDEDDIELEEYQEGETDLLKQKEERRKRDRFGTFLD